MCHGGVRPWNVYNGDRMIGTVYAGKMADEEIVKRMAIFQGIRGATRAELVESKDRW